MRIKQLPPNPNLDHLKRQAKDLLAALRESDPSATLADAQRAIAEDYELRTWPELKAEVERRRAQAQPVDPGLVERLAHAFGLGEPEGGASIVAHDFQGVRVRFHTATGDWMAHQVFRWVDDDAVARSQVLVQAARQMGVTTPEAVQTESGGWVAAVEGAPWRVDRWMDAGPPLPKPAPAATIRRVGELLGMLHSLALEADGPMNRWLTRRRPADEWGSIHRHAVELDAPWAEALELALPTIEELTSIAPTPTEGPLVLSHTDLGGESLRSGPGHRLTVLGWDFAGPTVPALELGYTLNAWGTDQRHEVDPRRAAAVIDGYASTCTTMPSLDERIFGSAVSAWLNQLASRMTTSCWSEDPDERRRATIEVTHLLTHPMSRDRLAATLAAVA
jgi:hypothetical protein